MEQGAKNKERGGGKVPFLKTNTGFVVLTFCLAVVVGVALVAATLFWLDGYTRHGQELTVPDVKGMFVDEAEMIASQKGLNIQVVDSTYSRNFPLGSVVDQTPPADSHAKEGRAIYVIVNAKAVRTVPLPDMRDVSARQAQASLRSLGFVVDEEVEYEPSVYKDLVLDVKTDGVVVEPGTRIKEGQTLTLVVGFGQGTEQVRIPDLVGKNKTDARSFLLHSRLILGAVEYDTELTPENDSLFVVYEQSPLAGTEILEGSRVDIRMTKSLEKVAAAAVSNNDEEFF